MNTIKIIIRLLPRLTALTTIIVFLMIFCFAWLNDYSVLVSINDYNEAFFEMFILCPLALIGFFQFFKDLIIKLEKM